jgi:hypothetical protein
MNRKTHPFWDGPFMAGEAGFEPANGGSKGRCLSHLATPHLATDYNIAFARWAREKSAGGWGDRLYLYPRADSDLFRITRLWRRGDIRRRSSCVFFGFDDQEVLAHEVQKWLGSRSRHVDVELGFR